MPGPGPHMMYALAAGAGLMRVSGGRFGPHHCLFYSLNAFLGPDLGSFAEWLTSFTSATTSVGSLAMELIHHPFYYVAIHGLPFSFFYCSLSRFLIRKKILDSFSSSSSSSSSGGGGMGLSRWQCFLLVAAGSFSHFFLDHLFEENGHSSMYTWILSTGWWNGRAPINADAVLVVGLLCSSLIGGFIYINRVKQGESAITKSNRTLKLILMIACLYCLWCASQIYWRDPRQPAVGEEADLGVLVFLAMYFFLPHSLCILSMNQKEDTFIDTSDQLPL